MRVRSLAALTLAATLFAASKATPVVAALLRQLSAEQAAALGASPPLASVAGAIPAEQREAAAASLRPLETGAPPATLVELTRAYLLLSRAADADRVSRLAAAAMPGADGHAFRAWAAAQAGDHASAAAAAREALRLEPGRKDALAVLKLTEGRGESMARPDTEKPSAQPAVRPVADQSHAIERQEKARAGLRLLGEAIRARDMGDRARALELARKAAAADPLSPEPQAFLEKVAESGDANEKALAETLTLLRQSGVGKEIADFIQAQVSIKYSPQVEGTLAYYIADENTIYLSSDFNRYSPILRANVLGHEGHHAIQDIRDGLAVTLETEMNAAVRGYAVHYELAAKGIPSASGEPLVDERLRLFSESVRTGKLHRIRNMVEQDYKYSAARARDRIVEAKPALLQRPTEYVLKATDLPVFSGSMYVHELKAHWLIRLAGDADGLERALRKDQEEVGWFKQWRNNQQSR